MSRKEQFLQHTIAKISEQRNKSKNCKGVTPTHIEAETSKQHEIF